MVRGRKETDFMEWFSQILLETEIYDYRYPIKGMGIWLPFGFRIRENMLRIIRKNLNGAGHQEVLFPLLVPEYNLKRESEHIVAFESEVYWVTHGGKDKLKVRYALRPTSETAIYPMYALWIRSHRDLPIKYYQIVNIFRYETKTTRPIIRVREVLTFKEAHTAHATREEAERQIKEAITIYSKIFEEMAIPYLILKRPDWDKFAGAEYSIAFDTILPNGRRLQIGTVHYLGQNFAKAFDIKYLKPDGEHEYVYQTCYGISGRPIAAVIAIHSDERGLVLPPSVAPLKVVIIPIYYERGKVETFNLSREIEIELNKSGITAIADLREKDTPGAKYFYWERRGIPLRIEIGMKEVSGGFVTVFRRDTLKRERVERDNVVSRVRDLLNEIQWNLKEKGEKFLLEKIKEVNDLSEASREIERGLVVILPWCGSESCGEKMEEKLGAKVFGHPLDGEYEGKCPVCGNSAKLKIYIGKSY